MIFTCVKRANTKIQMHKYTNTAYNKVPERPNMWYIFEKRIVQGYQKNIFPCVKRTNTKIQIHKYKNTQIRISGFFGFLAISQRALTRSLRFSNEIKTN